ncbi:SDR family NAD(P)-dependent oxidoreductase [Streptomyces sp. MSC1_001]|jgi:3-oxoacyl-[acyl-carrier protein] reductase|uniref:SDR family NAD(P)-dependent oxidoreductase n=1 Tax=Streptomyces sp. MSC1_001 TaxID=2909263 RepID=UPI00202ED051|nr:SDR family oxidoreductase [Streptomyces sp. MSC1_001]
MQESHSSRRTALVTGAARGIGRAIALELARTGHDVAVVDVDFEGFRAYDDDQTQTVMTELEAAGSRFLSAQASTTDATAMEEVVARVTEEWGGLHALVCNAGGGSGPLDGNRGSAVDLEQLDEVMRRNLYGTITTVQAALPAMLGADRPAVVTMGSVTGVQPNDTGTYTHYGVSKAAVMHYTRYLAADLAAQGVRANCVAPGPIATGRLRMRAREIGERDAGRAEELMARVGTEADVARAVRYLATPESQFMSGHILHLYR